MTKPPYKKMSLRNWLAVLLSIASFALFVPGISLSMLRIGTSGSVDLPMDYVEVEFFNTSNSILQTVRHLFRHQNKFVACMIFLFSIIVPIIKGLLFGYVLLSTNPIRKKVLNFMQAIGKWVMCDVFIVAIFLAYLSTGSASKESVHDVSIFGFSMEADISTQMTAKLEIGFYYFLAYCLLSLISFQLYTEKENKK
jgi:paraquat-inducible protein A